MDTAAILEALKLSTLPADSDLLSPERWKNLKSREAQVLRAAVELGRRALSAVQPERKRIVTAKDAAEQFVPHLKGLAHEEFWILILDSRLQVRGLERISSGGQASCAVSPRDVMRAALLNGAIAIVSAHNHPSGDPTPSADDHRVWQQLHEAARACGIRLVDNVVIGEGRFYSESEGFSQTL